jgi:hypothetical protein
MDFELLATFGKAISYLEWYTEIRCLRVTCTYVSTVL